MMITDDDLIRMAREAGIDFSVKDLRTFADIIAKAERERISDEWADRVQRDFEHGIKWVSEHYAAEFKEKYPSIYDFGRWLNWEDHGGRV